MLLEIARNDLDETKRETAPSQARGRCEREARAGYPGLPQNISARETRSCKHHHHTNQARVDLICVQNQIQRLAQALTRKRTVFQTRLVLRKEAFLRAANARSPNTRAGLSDAAPGAASASLAAPPCHRTPRPQGPFPKPQLEGLPRLPPTRELPPSQEAIRKIPTARDRCKPTAGGKPAF